MAEIRSINMKNDEIIVNLSVAKAEYDLINNQTADLLLLPSGEKSMNLTLTTGKLGNSNRIMMPKKILEKYGIKVLLKKAPAKAVRLNDDVFLLVKIKESEIGIPKFG